MSSTLQVGTPSGARDRHLDRGRPGVGRDSRARRRDGPDTVGRAAELRTISVTGSGTAEVVPDIARISVGVATRGRDATEASSPGGRADAGRHRRAGRRGRGRGRHPDQSCRPAAGPSRDRSGEGTRAIIGWQASNRVSATVRDIDATGDVIDAAIAAGATDVGNIAFRKDDPSAAEAEARQAAVDEAAIDRRAARDRRRCRHHRRGHHHRRRQRRRRAIRALRGLRSAAGAPGDHARPRRHHPDHGHGLRRLRDRLDRRCGPPAFDRP